MQVNTLFSPDHPRHTSQWYICCDNAKILFAGCSFLSSVEYQIWVGSSQIQSWWNETELSDGVEMVSWPGIFFGHVSLYKDEQSNAFSFCVMQRNEHFSYYQEIQNETQLCCRWIFSSNTPGVPDKFRCEAFTSKTSITTRSKRSHDKLRTRTRVHTSVNAVRQPSFHPHLDWKLAVIYSEPKNAIFFSVSSPLFIFRLFGVEKTIM